MVVSFRAPLWLQKNRARAWNVQLRMQISNWEWNFRREWLFFVRGNGFFMRSSENDFFDLPLGCCRGTFSPTKMRTTHPATKSAKNPAAPKQKSDRSLLSSAANSVSSARNSVSSLLHANSRLREHNESLPGTWGPQNSLSSIPWPSNPCFFYRFPCVFCFSISLLFSCVLPFFSKEFVGSAKRKPLPFWCVFLGFFSK